MYAKTVIETFKTWDEVIKAYRDGLIDCNTLLELMDWYNVR